MTIKEVEKKLSISRANIRFYEKEGLLEPKRNDNEYRNYSDEDLKRLEKIILFRKCNVSIENIRLIFNGTKNIDEVFKEQINVIENEVKQLEGAKLMCEKLSHEKKSIDEIDTEKYINIIKKEEEKGKRFNNIAEDYMFATEKLYQSIIENKEFKGGEIMRKGIKAGLYILSAVIMFILFVLFDYIFDKNIDWIGAIILASVLTIGDIFFTKNYIEKKSGEKMSNKESLKYSLIIVLIMIISLFGYYTIELVNDKNKEPNNNVLEMSVKKTLIDIANKEFKNNNNYTYAECHKILDSEIKENDIYVYVSTNYGLFSETENKLTSVDSKQVSLTLIYKKDKTKEGTYELKSYNDTIPSSIKDKTVINCEDNSFSEQMNDYLNR